MSTTSSHRSESSDARRTLTLDPHRPQTRGDFAIERELQILRNLRSSDSTGRDSARCLLRLAGHFSKLPNGDAATKLLSLAHRVSPRAFTAETYEELRRILGAGCDGVFTQAGIALRERGEHHRAIDLLTAVATHGSPAAIVALAECHATYGDYNRAIGHLDDAVDKLEQRDEPKRGPLWRRILELALQIEPQDEEARRRMVRLDLDEGDPQRAMHQLSFLLASSPSDLGLLEMMSECLARSGRRGAAVASLRHVAGRHVEAGRRAWARQLLQRASSWSPDDSQYAAAIRSLRSKLSPTRTTLVAQHRALPPAVIDPRSGRTVSGVIYTRIAA